jgi:hypothetical protein
MGIADRFNLNDEASCKDEGMFNRYPWRSVGSHENRIGSAGKARYIARLDHVNFSGRDGFFFVGRRSIV